MRLKYGYLKNLPAMQETRVGPLGREDSPWRRKWQPIPVFLPGKSHKGVWQATVHGVEKRWT